MSLLARWFGRDDRDDQADRETAVVDETVAQVSAQVEELRRTLRRIERREAARHGRPETA